MKTVKKKQKQHKKYKAAKSLSISKKVKKITYKQQKKHQITYLPGKNSKIA